MRAGSGVSDPVAGEEALRAKQAHSVRVLLMALFGTLAVVLGINVLLNGPDYLQRSPGLLMVFTMAVTALAYIRLRANRFSQAIRAVVLGSLLILVVETVTDGVLAPATRHLFAYAIPIAFAALLLGRAALWLTVAFSVFVVTAVFVLETRGVAWVGTASGELTEIAIPILFALVMGLLGLVLDRFGLTLRQALDQVSRREQEQSQLVDRLEREVEERQRAVSEREALLDRERAARSRAEELATENADLLDRIRRLNNQLERRVEERTLELELALQEVEMFAQSVAHDLKTPLRGIDGFSQLLLEEYGGGLDATAVGYLRRIRGGARRLGELTDALLALSRLSRHPLRPDVIDLGERARTILDQLRVQRPDKRVEAQIADGMIVTCDPTLVGLVLEALLDNALKFSPTERVARIEVGTYSHEGERVFFVRDNGVGFDMRYAERIFAPFQRLHPQEEYEGAGVGLSLAQRIVERHGGRIWTSGEPGQGATFFFTLGPPGRGG